MRPLEITALRHVAVRVLEHRAGPDADAAVLAAAAHRAYEELDRVLAPLIGPLGVDALSARAIALVQPEYPWLARTRDPDRAARPLADVVSSMEQNPAFSLDAAAAVLATFVGLLAQLIGEPLTSRLMRQAWPDASLDAGAEERRA